jgi:hypothetical protein
MGILNSKLCLSTLAAMGLLLSVSSSAQQGTASLAEQIVKTDCRTDRAVPDPDADDH